jgi:hypothetical protein
MHRERKNKNIALTLTAAIHGLLLLLLFFLAAWKAPNPPLPEYGIELNFGTSDSGSGTTQPQEPAGAPESQPEVAEQTAAQPETAASDPTPETATQTEGDVAVKEEPKKEVVKPQREPVTKPAETPREEPKAVFNPTETATGKPASQGDDVAKTGDKGSAEGTVDARALFGNQGGGSAGDGMNLQMSGWQWADEPVIPNLPDNQDGRVVFEIECDDQGEILTITTIERGLSPQAERLLRDVIRKNSLIRTTAGIPPARSKGRVVFVLKTK